MFPTETSGLDSRTPIRQAERQVRDLADVKAALSQALPFGARSPQRPVRPHRRTFAGSHSLPRGWCGEGVSARRYLILQRRAFTGVAYEYDSSIGYGYLLWNQIGAGGFLAGRLVSPGLLPGLVRNKAIKVASNGHTGEAARVWEIRSEAWRCMAHRFAGVQSREWRMELLACHVRCS